MALVQDGGDVGVIETLLVLGAQGGGAQSCAVGVLRLPPEMKQTTETLTSTLTQLSEHNHVNS